ncbi:MAG TPA: MSMEG_0567/Sll0786 family nitrogen starvation N-acetyltransferase [Streptosporangiaceae bacterium]|nr:MSMEG_0567/Sll0786 family nitrogen starvation N-acetyltransferase [Streptosporangiaceae bacterium]
MAEPSFRSSATASLPGRSSPTAATPLLACEVVATEAERCAHFRIRHQVFVIEQGMFGGSYGDGGGPGDDADVHDDDPATIHVIGRAGETICGTVRLYPLGADGRWKGDRLAVLASYRHLGLGAPLVRFAVSAAARLGGREMEAFIQPANVAFFRWLGWERTGNLADYAGLPHQRMLIDLTRQT